MLRLLLCFTGRRLAGPTLVLQELGVPKDVCEFAWSIPEAWCWGEADSVMAAAAISNAVPVMAGLIKFGAPDVREAFRVAFRNKDPKLVSTLFSLGLKTDADLLAEAAATGEMALFEAVLGGGSHVPCDLALLSAARRGHPHIVSEALARGALSQKAAVIAAVNGGSAEAVEMVLGDLQRRGDWGDFGSWFRAAVLMGNQPVADLLVQATAEAEYSPKLATALQVALDLSIQYDRPEMTKLFLTAGAVPTPGGPEERLLLPRCVERGQVECARALIEVGAAPLDVGILGHAARCGHLEILKLFIDAGASLNDLDSRGWSALTWAIDRNQVAAARLLLSRGAVPDPIRGGETPLLRAIRRRNLEAVEVLLSAKARIGSGLHAAAQRGWIEGVEVLLKAGADPNAAVGGRTPLWLACSSLSEKTIALLLAAGANRASVGPGVIEFLKNHGKAALAATFST